MAEATPVANAVIEAVKDRARGYRKTYKNTAKLAASAQEQAVSLYEDAAEYREKAESCEQWLDLNAPGWREEDDE